MASQIAAQRLAASVKAQSEYVRVSRGGGTAEQIEAASAASSAAFEAFRDTRQSAQALADTAIEAEAKFMQLVDENDGKTDAATDDAFSAYQNAMLALASRRAVTKADLRAKALALQTAMTMGSDGETTIEGDFGLAESLIDDLIG